MLTVRRVPRSRVALPAALSSLESVVALALAHVAAGGEVPSPAWLAAFGVLVYGAGVVVLRQKASLRLVLPALLATQVLGHAWLVALTPAAHQVHGETGAVLGLSWPMVAAHVTAAAVTGVVWLLRRRAVSVLLHRAEAGRLPLPQLRTTPPRSTDGTPKARLALATAPTRGPPTALLATT